MLDKKLTYSSFNFLVVRMQMKSLLIIFAVLAAMLASVAGASTPQDIKCLKGQYKILDTCATPVEPITEKQTQQPVVKVKFCGPETLHSAVPETHK